MSSRRTRKNSRRSNRRTRQRGGKPPLDPLASIFAPPPKKGILAPIKSAERLVAKAAELINAGSELPEPTGNKKLKKLNPDKRRKLKGIQVKERIKDRKKKRELSQQNNKLIKEVEEANAQFSEIQRQFNPKPPSQPRETKKRRPVRKRTRKTRKIIPKKPKTPSPSKRQGSRPTARTRKIIPKPPSKSQNPQKNRRSKRLKDKRLKEKKKRNFLDKIKTTLKTQINNMDEPFKAAKGRTRNPPNRLTYTK